MGCVDFPRFEKYNRGMQSAGKSEAKERFLRFLGAKGLRVTAQRRAIVDTVFATEEHFTAEQLLGWARARDQSVSRATVYRTLPLLTESGYVREVDLGQDQKRYDTNYIDRPHHGHLICEECARVVEFENDKLEQLQRELGRQLGFRIKSLRLQITGSCKEFKKFGVCNKGCGR